MGRGLEDGDQILTAVLARVPGARAADGELVIDGGYDLRVELGDRGLSARFVCETGAVAVVGTTRARRHARERLPWSGALIWYADHAPTAASVAPDAFRRSMNELARLGAVEVRIAGDHGQVNVSFPAERSLEEGAAEAIRILDDGVRALPPSSSGGHRLAAPAIRIVGARIVDLARLETLGAHAPLPERDDVHVFGEGQDPRIERALVVDLEGPLPERRAALEVWPHQVWAGGRGSERLWLPATKEGVVRTARRFVAHVLDARPISWRVLSAGSDLLAHGEVTPLRYPGDVARAIAARLPGARAEGAAVTVAGPPAARIRLTGQWRGEGKDPPSWPEWDPLQRAAYSLLGERFVRAAGLLDTSHEPPELLVEAAAPRGGVKWLHAARMRAEARRTENLRLFFENDRAVIIAPLWGLSPSRIERRAEVALSLLATLVGSDRP